MEIFLYILGFLLSILSLTSGCVLLAFSYSELKDSKSLHNYCAIKKSTILPDKLLELCGIISGIMLIIFGLGVITWAIFYG